MAEVFQKNANGDWVPLFSKTVCPFPIGVIMPMSGSQNPNTIWDGTLWNKLADGKFLMSDSTGGKAEVNAQIPKHLHKGIRVGQYGIGWNVYGSTTGFVGIRQNEGGAIYSNDIETYDETKTSVTGLDIGDKVIPTGTIKVCMWERIA